MPVIQTRGLTKVYARNQVGVSELDLAVEQGEVFGFLGPNGAGKTTTLRCLMGLIRPTRGQAEIFGQDPQRVVSVRREIGYLPGELALYENLSGRALLGWFARLRGTGDLRPALALAERLRLDLGRHVHDLSRGNKQKLGVVLALMHTPALALLDEPTSGLDPLAQQEFAAIVGEARAAGRTVVLSSHVLSEVEQLAGRVAILREGRLVVVDAVAALKQRALRRFELEFPAAPDPVPFTAVAGVREAEAAGRFLRCAVAGPVGPLLRAAADSGLVNVISHEPDLEEIFLSYVKGGDGRGASGVRQDAA
jgi:beta-exotoxin I transport system ATP-binding protein